MNHSKHLARKGEVIFPHIFLGPYYLNTSFAIPGKSDAYLFNNCVKSDVILKYMFPIKLIPRMAKLSVAPQLQESRT